MISHIPRVPCNYIPHRRLYPSLPSLLSSQPSSSSFLFYRPNQSQIPSGSAFFLVFSLSPGIPLLPPQSECNILRTPHSREADRYRYERSDLILTEEGPLSTFEDWPDIETSL